MRGDQLARQWRVLRMIESQKQGATVAELAAREGCHPCTIWGRLAPIQPANKRSSRSRKTLRTIPTYISIMPPKVYLGENRA